MEKISSKCFCRDINFNEYSNIWKFRLQIAVVIVGIDNISSPSVQSLLYDNLIRSQQHVLISKRYSRPYNKIQVHVGLLSVYMYIVMKI